MRIKSLSRTLFGFEERPRVWGVSVNAKNRILVDSTIYHISETDAKVDRCKFIKIKACRRRQFIDRTPAPPKNHTRGRRL